MVPVPPDDKVPVDAGLLTNEPTVIVDEEGPDKDVDVGNEIE
jgi:hypothetical protein